MISLSKIVAAVAIGSILAAGSAYALLSPAGTSAGMPSRDAVPFTAGFVTGDAWNCTTSGAPTNVALTFENRWNGQWEPVSNDFSRFAWASCTNSWAYGHLNLPNSQPTTVANARTINLSTLPLMR